MFKKILPFLVTLTPLMSIAQKKGLDEEINEEFMPIATWWENTVLTPIHIAGNDIPFALLLLVFGATMFTIYFGFPAVSKFRLAINTVRGKYDEIDHHSVEKANLNIIDGDLVDTIKDESKDGEVSHFQALATALISARMG